MTGRDKFKKVKGLLNSLSKIINFFPYKFQYMLYQFFSDIKGTKGIAIRYILLKNLLKSCGDNVSIHPNVYLFSLKNLSLGSNVSIHPMCYIDATGGIEIGNDVSLAHSVTIMSDSHTYSDVDIPIKYQPMIEEKVVIENNVWVGAKSTILCGNTIETGSVIGANSVVTKNVKKNSIVAGIPAKLIKNRI